MEGGAKEANAQPSKTQCNTMEPVQQSDVIGILLIGIIDQELD